ncbi:MAG: phosphate ABC transporter permease subunit PstC [Spirochaetia bacterium]|jgi:phosphate transport system permease protein
MTDPAPIKSPAPAKSPALPAARVGGRTRLSEFAIETLIRVLGFSTIGFVALIFLFLLREGVPVFFEVPLKGLFSAHWYPTFGIFGTLPLILGSLLVTLVSVIIALPLGVATAVFVREVAPRWTREILKPIIEVLAGIPSVVLGFFGMTFVAPIVRDVLGAPTGLTAFSGAFILAYMALPTIISVADDALDSVPKSYRDAGLAMGATRWQTIWRVIVPAAGSGIVTAVMLGMGRAIGETMAVMMVTGNAAVLPDSIASLFRPIRTMTATIAAEMGEVARGSTHYHALFGIGIILFVLTFLINLTAASTILKKKRRGGLR